MSYAGRLCCVTALCLLVGCRLHGNLTKTVLIEPFHFREYWAESTEQLRYERLATHVYDGVACRDLAAKPPAHYKQGFTDGFVDFMVAGGTAIPPALPPREFWQPRKGRQHAAANWYSGFAAGASTARDGGYRNLVTIPVRDRCLEEVPSIPSLPVAPVDSTPATVSRTNPESAKAKRPAIPSIRVANNYVVSRPSTVARLPPLEASDEVAIQTAATKRVR